MARALELARRGVQTTHPNPRVGCVVVSGGDIVGEGFHERAGEPHAEVVALRTTRRFGPRLLLAAQRVAGGIALPGTIPEAARADFAAPVAEPGPHGDGRVEVLTFDTERAETEHLADLLRRAHLEDGIPWDDMAVLVRSGRTSIPGLRRSLGAAGVPVEVAGDDVPLVRDPAALPLLDEATAAAVAGDAALPISGAWACCFLVSSCLAVRDLERASEWCDRIAVFAERYGSRYLLAFCRSEYGAVHLWRGEWDLAGSFLEAAIYAAKREQWGRRIDSYPMVRETLIDLLVELEAGMALTFECAAASRTATDEEEGRLLRRILVPLAKIRATRQAVAAASSGSGRPSNRSRKATGRASGFWST